MYIDRKNKTKWVEIDIERKNSLGNRFKRKSNENYRKCNDKKIPHKILWARICNITSFECIYFDIF